MTDANKTFNEVDHLKTLGVSSGTDYSYDEPTAKILETFDNTAPGRPYIIELKLPEWTGMCLAGDTLIDVARDESVFPKGIPIKDLVGTEGIVFSFDKKLNTPVARKYTDVRCTRTNVETVIVKFKKIRRTESGVFETIEQSMTMTPDHQVLVQKGIGAFKWIEAQNLKESDQLVVEQRVDDCIRGKARHRLIKEYQYGRLLETVEHVHHIDHNHINNDPVNLDVLHMSDHFRLHRHSEYIWDETLDVDELVMLYNNGDNFSSLAKKYGCDTSTIYSRIEHLVTKRSQSESLKKKPESIAKMQLAKECSAHYLKGYTIYELSSYYEVHSTTIMTWIKKSGVKLRSSVQTKELRKVAKLSGLNHRVISVVTGKRQDVYNMEVEDTECFFAEGIVVHNCPKTGQPDMAHINIKYIPHLKCLESKSIKLYVVAYRNYGCFMESTTNKFIDDFVEACDPNWIYVEGLFQPRGGIELNVYAEYTKEGFTKP